VYTTYGEPETDMQVIETIFYFVITLGVLVFVHELGHVLAAKAFRMRVDRFSIGFPPRAFGKLIGETDYCVSWIPIGGYVKIAGMIDESFDTDFINRPAEPWEFRAKPVWQRMIVMVAGVVMNLLLAVAVFWGINYVQGKTVRETTEIGAVMEKSPAAQAGLQPGDRVRTVNGTAVTNWDALLNEMYLETLGHDLELGVDRAGRFVTLTLPRSAIPDPAQTAFGIVPAQTEVVVGTVESGLPADKAGLRPNDVITRLADSLVQYDGRVREIVRAHAGVPMMLEWRRGTDIMRATVVPTSDGRIGISFGARYTGPVSRIEYTLLEALPQGFRDIVNVSGLFVQQIWQIITGKTAFAQSVGGPIRIAQMATQTAEMGVLTYLGFMALLSVSLAILNLLPIPALDGGHLLLLLIEAVIRREIPVRMKIGVQKVGFVLLLLLMGFVLYNDIVHF
jgi:regulator of sigma E protease